MCLEDMDIDENSAWEEFKRGPTDGSAQFPFVKPSKLVEPLSGDVSDASSCYHR